MNPARIFGDHGLRAVWIVEHLVVPEPQHTVALVTPTPAPPIKG
jgi:hypothetical protein